MGGVGEHRADRPAPLAAVRPLRGHPGLLLEAKLHAPDARQDWVPRRQLVRDLIATGARLVLVEAPAGYGKTILVSQLRSAAAQSRAYAWVSLDRGDDDPARLWWHVVSALQRVSPGLGGTDLRRFLATQDPDVEGELMPRLVNALAERPEPLSLVLDDYYLVTEPRCHAQIEFLLLNLVPPTQMVIITRAEPPLPLARLRATGDLAEIRMKELRFGPDTAAALIYRVAAVRLSEPDLLGLVQRTEGWPAGVYLAALSLRGSTDPGAVVRQISGTNRYIADYLFEEVINRQPSRIRQFLTHTSILRWFTAPLCEAVTETADAAEVIDLLERQNLFVVPLDEDRQWFRYHRLFRQTLRRQLESREPRMVSILHRRASAWHAAHGPAEEAVDHALAGGDVAGAAGLMAAHWTGFVSAGRSQTVRRWIDQLGDEQITAKPLAAHCAAWMAALAGEPEKVRRLVPVIRAGEHAGRLPDGMRSLEFSAALLHGVFGFDGIRVMRESAARAAELEDDPTSPWYPLAQAALGFSRYLSGEPEAETLARIAASDPPDPLVRLMAYSGAALSAAEQGELQQARWFASAARLLVDHGGLGKAPQSTLAYVASGIVHADEGRLAEARGDLEQALESRRRRIGLSPWATFEAMLRLASVLLDLGDRAGAAALLAEAEEILAALPDGAEAQRARLESLRQRLARGLHEHLTDQERAVLRLLRGTLSVREIGRELDVSRNTVKSHVRAIYRKLGVSSRDEAVARAAELGLLSRLDLRSPLAGGTMNAANLLDLHAQQFQPGKQPVESRLVEHAMHHGRRRFLRCRQPLEVHQCLGREGAHDAQLVMA
jgi:LuxR family maltose regulon positive regulatory protein